MQGFPRFWNVRSLKGIPCWSPHSTAPSQEHDTQKAFSKHLCNEGTRTALLLGVNGTMWTQFLTDSLHHRKTASAFPGCEGRLATGTTQCTRATLPNVSAAGCGQKGIAQEDPSYSSTTIVNFTFHLLGHFFIHSPNKYLLSTNYHQELWWAALPGLRWSSR